MIKELWYCLCRYVFILIPTSSFIQLSSFVNYKRLGYKWYRLNLKNPKTFNEKLNYLKINNRELLAQTVANKVEVRDYVSNTIGDNYLIPVIGIYKNAHQIDFDIIPKKFALKTNHGSGWNLICFDKDNLNWNKERKRLNKWLKKDAYFLSREWQYRNTKTKLICEQLLDYEIKDYKIFCFEGKPKYIQVDNGRFSNHERTLFDCSWKETNIQIRYKKISIQIEKPLKLEEMLEISMKLSKPFKFCRVDLYEHNNKVYFGEITMHPGGGIEPFVKYEDDLTMGNLINIK